jgi:hypothetical protein
MKKSYIKASGYCSFNIFFIVASIKVLITLNHFIILLLLHKSKKNLKEYIEINLYNNY